MSNEGINQNSGDQDRLSPRELTGTGADADLMRYISRQSSFLEKLEPLIDALSKLIMTVFGGGMTTKDKAQLSGAMEGDFFRTIMGGFLNIPAIASAMGGTTVDIQRSMMVGMQSGATVGGETLFGNNQASADAAMTLALQFSQDLHDNDLGGYTRRAGVIQAIAMQKGAFSGMDMTTLASRQRSLNITTDVLQAMEGGKALFGDLPAAELINKMSQVAPGGLESEESVKLLREGVNSIMATVRTFNINAKEVGAFMLRASQENTMLGIGTVPGAVINLQAVQQAAASEAGMRAAGMDPDFAPSQSELRERFQEQQQRFLFSRKGGLMNLAALEAGRTGDQDMIDAIKSADEGEIIRLFAAKDVDIMTVMEGLDPSETHQRVMMMDSRNKTNFAGMIDRSGRQSEFGMAENAIAARLSAYGVDQDVSDLIFDRDDQLSDAQSIGMTKLLLTDPKTTAAQLLDEVGMTHTIENALEADRFREKFSVVSDSQKDKIDRGLFFGEGARVIRRHGGTDIPGQTMGAAQAEGVKEIEDVLNTKDVDAPIVYQIAKGFKDMVTAPDAPTVYEEWTQGVINDRYGQSITVAPPLALPPPEDRGSNPEKIPDNKPWEIILRDYNGSKLAEGVILGPTGDYNETG